MIVSFPLDAAETICCSIDLLIFAVRFCTGSVSTTCKRLRGLKGRLYAARLASRGWFSGEKCYIAVKKRGKGLTLGAMNLLPFFGAAAALAACREDEAFACKFLVFPCTMAVETKCDSHA
jgi:hypothetical protein